MKEKLLRYLLGFCLAAGLFAIMAIFAVIGRAILVPELSPLGHFFGTMAVIGLMFVAMYFFTYWVLINADKPGSSEGS